MTVALIKQFDEIRKMTSDEIKAKISSDPIFKNVYEEYVKQIIELTQTILTLNDILENDDDAELKAFSELSQKIHWFHCSYLSIGETFEYDVLECYNKSNDILLIDKMFFDFYDKRMDLILDYIQSYEHNNCRAELIRQAINAYLNKEYYLTITSLMTVIEMPVYEKTSMPQGGHSTKKFKQSLDELALSDRNKKLLKFITWSNFFDCLKNQVYCNYNINLPQVNTFNVEDGIPNRNIVAHGFRLDYANKKTALNSIILVLILLCLHTK